MICFRPITTTPLRFPIAVLPIVATAPATATTATPDTSTRRTDPCQSRLNTRLQPLHKLRRDAIAVLEVNSLDGGEVVNERRRSHIRTGKIQVTQRQQIHPPLQGLEFAVQKVPPR